MAYSRPYYLIVSRDCTTDDAKFFPQFGEHDREACNDELAEYKKAAKRDGTLRQTFYKIVKCDNASGKAVNAKLAELNK